MPSSLLTLRPSDAKRWMSCRGSPGLLAAHADQIPEEPKAGYTDEGIAAHEMAAAMLRNELLPADSDVEMAATVSTYANFVRDKVDGGTLFVEQKLPLFYMPERHGFVDAGIINSKGIYIVNLKYGEGVSVEAQKNEQLGIYGRSFVAWLEDSGLFDTFPDSTMVILAIFQPRARDKRVTRLWATKVGELREFTGKIDLAAHQIVTDPVNQPFAPSDDNCRFCPANRVGEKWGGCPHRNRQLMGELPKEALATLSSVQPEAALPSIDQLSMDQVSKIVRAGNALKKWIDDVRKHAYDIATKGTPIPGCKLVTGKSNRVWIDEERARELLMQKFSVNQVAPRSLVSVAQAEKLLKGQEVSTKFSNLMKAIIAKPEGSATLVPDDDPRPAIDADPLKEIKILNDSLLQ